MNESMPSPKAPGKESILGSLDNQLKLARKLETVYAERPELDDFAGSMPGTKYEGEYAPEAIEHDKEYVEKIRASIQESNSSQGKENLEHIEGGFQLSEIMQAMVVDRMNKHWYKDVKTIMTADYDDLRVGIDAVMKHEKGTYLGASFDFTVTHQEGVVLNKLNKEWEHNVVGGKIPAVKYFEDPDTKTKGRLLVPKFIIGASKEDVEELAAAYLSGDQELLENHPFKYVLLLQVEEQLQTVLDYYETEADPKTVEFAKKQYERIQALLRGMKKEIHLDENIQNLELFEHTKKSMALDAMRKFRITRQQYS